MKQIIYLDNASTTPVDPAVIDTISTFLKDHYANPASLTHQLGVDVETQVQQARQQIANIIHCQPSDIIWTSGATESNNISLIGTARKYRERGNHIITCQTEHKSILDPCSYLQTQGFEVTYLPVDQQGHINLEELKNHISDQTILVSLMAANNETGVIHPLDKIGQITHESNVLFHCDASQAFGKIPIDVQSQHIDLLSISGHKIYGPKGIGALYLRREHPKVQPEPLIFGGGHELGVRSGTLNVPGLMGLAKAAEISSQVMNQEKETLNQMANSFENALKNQLDGVFRNGDPDQCLPHIRNISFAGTDSETLMLALPELAVSSGSACTSINIEPSHVLTAMNIGQEKLTSAIRFSFGRFTTPHDIESAGQCVIDAVCKIRKFT